MNENVKCVISRKVEGICLNENEYILNDDGSVRIFENKIVATKFLTDSGLTDDDIEDIRFLDAEKYEQGISEIL